MRAPILGQIWREIGGKGKPPPVFIDRFMDNPKSDYGLQALYDRRIWLAPKIAQQIRYAPLNPQAAKEGLKVLLHEYNHVKQPRAYPGPRVEPAAEARAHMDLDRIMDRLGAGALNAFAPGPNRPSVTYGPWMNRQNRKMGGANWERFIRKGQFGKR